MELEALLSDKKTGLAGKETVKNYVNEPRNMLEKSTIAERKFFIKSLSLSGK